MKKLGVIGGLGPDTTAKFYSDVVAACKENDGSKTPPIDITSVSVPYSLYQEVIVNNANLEGFLPHLTQAAQTLENSGSEIIVMPCNTLHVHIQKIREAVKIPVLSIIEETADFLKCNSLDNVGIISTVATLNSKLYENELTKKNIQHVTPSNEEQVELNDIVFRLVSGEINNVDRESLIRIINNFGGLDCAILACTDLQLLNPLSDKIKIIDTMSILVNSAVREILNNT